MIVDQRSTQIGTLRIRSTQLDSMSARLRYESAISAASIKPRNLAPAAIVCIRRFRDPNPRLLASQYIGTPVSLVWEKAVADALDRMVSGAVRPVDGPVSGFQKAD